MVVKNSGLAYRVPDDEFKNIILSSSSCVEAMQKLGFTCAAGNAKNTVKRRIVALGISTLHWSDNTKNAHLTITTSHEEYFSENNPHSGGHIRERLLKYNLLEYCCAVCGNKGEWLGKELRLQIDHINGNHSDNRLCNLRFLCPNCHAQTDTFGGKNVRHSKNQVD